MTQEIPKYILERSTVNGLYFYKYLHIRGGAGKREHERRRPYGGEYDYLIFYADSDELDGCDYCERLWCIDKKIPFGVGETIDKAYKDYLKKTSKVQNLEVSDTTEEPQRTEP